MVSVITRFKNELLDADLDLNACDLTTEEGKAIEVTARLSPARLFFAALFALPGLFFLHHVAGTLSLVNLALALVICPPLFLMALLLGGTIARKRIDWCHRQATKSLRFFSFSTEVAEPLAPRGAITLSWKWSKSGAQSKGHHTYTVTVCSGTGLVFTTMNDYSGARAFAERLEDVLSFPLEDSVPPQHRGPRPAGP